MAERERSIDLYWIPLGAGAHVVRISGRLFEAISAAAGRRPRCDLYRSALVVSAGDGHFVIGQAPVPDLHGARRGVIAAGFGIDISSIQPPAGGRAPGWNFANRGAVAMSMSPPTSMATRPMVKEP